MDALLKFGVIEYNKIIFQYLKTTSYPLSFEEDYPLLENEDNLVREDIFTSVHIEEFSTEVIKTSYGSKERNDFLAKTIDFFKENEIINVERFKEEIFEEEKHIDLFESYKKDFEAEQNVVIRNQFDVSEKVLTKEKKKIKTDIKLDTHIQIKLDIDAPDAASEHLERGYDEDKKMHYYKVYFNAED